MRKKILFVTHALESPYGAATSLRLLLKNYTDIDADLIVPRSLRHPRDLTATAALFPSVRQVYEISMPVDLGVVGMARSFAEKAHGAVHWLNWQRDRGRYRKILRDNNYDLVHFNSVVLHRMLSPGIPAIAHIREIIPNSDAPVIDKLASSTGVVFIDSTTRQPFVRRKHDMHALTLNNPIDMRGAASHAQTLRHPRLGPSTTVFSMIGRMSALKGVHLVISAFREGAGADSLLLVAGDGPEDYVTHCRALAADDDRIIFWGEEKDIEIVYAATDYVVRGDPQPCVGRTVYEGLYAGCRVIMPGPGTADLIFEAEKFQDAILFYQPGDRNALANLFTENNGLKIQNREYRSNVQDYVQAFDRFADVCILRHKEKPQ